MPGVAERRLKVSIGSSVPASLRDAQPFPTVIPWAQAHGYHHAVAPRLLKKRAVENWWPLGAHFAFGAPGHHRFCLAERGHEGSRGLQSTGTKRKCRASLSDA